MTQTGPTQQTRVNPVLDGAVTGTLLRLAWPMIVSNQLTNGVVLITALWVGRFVGKDGLAVLAVWVPVELLLAWLLAAITQGHGSLISQSIGNADGQGLRLVGASLVLKLIASLALAGCGLLALEPLVHLLSGESDLVPMFRSYLVPFFLSLPVLGIAEILLETALCAGRTRLAMFRVLFDLCLMATLMPILIQIFGLGVAAAPWAVLIAAVILDVSLAFTIVRSRREMGLGDWPVGARVIDPALWLQLLGIGAPIQLGRVASFAAQIGLVHLVARAGKIETAGYGLCIDVLFVAPLATMGVAAANAIVVGQSRGAARPARARMSIARALLTNFVIAAALIAAVPLARPLFRLFSNDLAVIDAAMEALLLMRWSAIGIGVWQVLATSSMALGTSTRAGLAMVVFQGLGVGVAYSVGLAPLKAAAIGFAVAQLGTAGALMLIFPTTFRKAFQTAGEVP